MVPVLTSFLPPTHADLYLPMLFKLWEPFNSSAMDDRLLDLAGSLAEEHVAGLNREEKGGAQWKDVGIWSQIEWNVLIGKGLGSMSMCATASLTELSSLCLSQTFLWVPHKYAGSSFCVICVLTHVQGASTTSNHADLMADKSSLRIKKTIHRFRLCPLRLQSTLPKRFYRLPCKDNCLLTGC